MAFIDKLVAIADAIRGKTGKAEEMTLDQMVVEIEGIETGTGGACVSTGTFTPAETIQSITLEFDKPISNVIIVQSVPTLNLGYSVHYVSCYISGNVEFFGTSNIAGNNWATITPGTSNITIADDGMQLTATTNRHWGVIEYTWIAW